MLIYTGADGNYALQAQVWMLSLIKTQCTSVQVVVFGNGWSDKDKRIMKALENELVKVEFREVDVEHMNIPADFFE